MPSMRRGTTKRKYATRTEMAELVGRSSTPAKPIRPYANLNSTSIKFSDTSANNSSLWENTFDKQLRNRGLVKQNKQSNRA